MKKVSLISVLSFLSIFPTLAQKEHNEQHKDSVRVFHQTNDNNHVESQHLFIFESDKVKVEHLFNGYFFHFNKPTSKWGVWSTFWIEVDPKWAQALFGVMRRFHMPGDGILEVGIGTAVEQDDMPIRASALVTYEDRSECFTALASFEYGGSGHWYVGSVNYRLNKFLGLGLHVQRFAASGPRINLHLAKRFSIWMTGGIDIESPYGEHYEEKKLQFVLTGGLRMNFIKADVK